MSLLVAAIVELDAGPDTWLDECRRVCQRDGLPLPPRKKEKTLMLFLRKLSSLRAAGVDAGRTGLAEFLSSSWPECSTTRILSLSRDAHRWPAVSFLFRVFTRAIILAVAGDGRSAASGDGIIMQPGRYGG